MSKNDLLGIIAVICALALYFIDPNDKPHEAVEVQLKPVQKTKVLTDAEEKELQDAASLERVAWER